MLHVTPCQIPNVLLEKRGAHSLLRYVFECGNVWDLSFNMLYKYVNSNPNEVYKFSLQLILQDSASSIGMGR